MTCDGGSTNHALLKSLGISTEKTSFTNPSDPDRQIYVFLDIPHVLKLIRNHILDEGIWINGQPDTQIGQEDFLGILNTDKKEFRITHKLTDFHLTVVGPQRQRVRPDSQLLSHSTATAMRCLNNNKSVQANFVDLINNW